MAPQKITPFLWFDNQAEAAARWYTSLFKNSTIDSVNPMITTFHLNGFGFTALNGGPQFKFTNAISLFVNCANPAEIDYLWQNLSIDGTILMDLGNYSFCEKYGWVNDKYGLSWQLFLGEEDQKITPSLLFVGEQAGRANAAIECYTSLFDDSKIDSMERFGAAFPEMENRVQFCNFKLANQSFIAMESHIEHHFNFNEAFSFLISCDTQEEVDYFWSKLLENGGQESQCGWLKDPFGVSWQVIPKLLMELMGDPNREKANNVRNAMLQMGKIDCEKLKQAYNGN